MRNGMRIMGLAAVAALSLTALAIQNGVILKHAVKGGDTLKYKLVSELEAQGMPMVMNAVISDKVVKVGTEDYTEVVLKGGHIGIFVSARALAQLSATVVDWLQAR